MASIGPTLPPHLAAKRKRDDDNDKNELETLESPSSSSVSKKRCALGPSLPTCLLEAQTTKSDEYNHDELDLDLSTAEDKPVNKSSSFSLVGPSLPQSGPQSPKSLSTKILGPSLPPADLAQRPNVQASEDSDDESDDDFGPALPGSAPATHSTTKTAAESVETLSKDKPKSGRDEWMLAPPSGGDWTFRVDPSKMKNRGFASGKGARPVTGSNADISLWTETPEEKRKRLEEEMLGVRKADQPVAKDPALARKDAEAAEMAKKVKTYNERNRATPLYSVSANDPDEDDPSKRAFDRDKDIGGSRLSHSEQKKLLNRAADFDSRFSKGSYL